MRISIGARCAGLRPVPTFSAVALLSAAVLLGTAMLGAVAGGVYPDLTTAMRAMSRLSRLYPPKGGEVAARHDQRYLIWEALQTTARAATTV